MTHQTFADICKFLLKNNSLPEETMIVWHAGEPLVLGVPFYSEMLTIANNILGRETLVRFGFQTNGTLFNDDWVNFVQSSGSKISFSLDGPKWYHDSNRRYRSGDGSFENSMAGLQRAINAGISTSVISVISPPILPFAEEYFAFCVDSGCRRFGINIEENEGAHNSSDLYETDNIEEYRDFIQKLTQLSLNSEISIREIEDAKKCIIAGGNVQNSEVEPFSILNFNNRGEICLFSPELLTDPAFAKRYPLESVVGTTLDEMAARSLTSRLIKDVEAGVSKCRNECEYFDFCGGGAPSNKFSEHGDFATSYTNYCGYKKRVLLNGVLDGLG